MRGSLKRTVVQVPESVSMLVLQPTGSNALSTRSIVDLPAELIVQTLQVLLLHFEQQPSVSVSKEGGTENGNRQFEKQHRMAEPTSRRSSQECATENEEEGVWTSIICIVHASCVDKVSSSRDWLPAGREVESRSELQSLENN